nr:hypothetical protein A6C57_16515 [Fibrella sp. ES10-3-2-2]
MKMNKVLLAVGLLSAGVAFGQNQTTRTSSTTTSTSNYNSSNTNNENSRNATMGTNSSTNRPTSTTGTPYSSGSTTGSSMGTSGMSTGSYSNSSATGSYNSTGMGTGTASGSYSGSSTSGSYNSNGMGTGTSTTGSYNSNSGMGSSTTTPSTNGSYNSNSMGTGTSTTTPSTNGSYNTNSMGNGTSATTPTTTDTYNSGAATNGSTVTTNSTYSTETTARPARTNDYKNFAYGIYAGVNTTRFRGESINAENPSGRLGYQAGFFVRGGGRLFGQIGAEYFASSSNYFRPNDGQSAAAIRDQINIRYIQVPVYIGYKLTESDRGISAIRVQAGVEYANRISSTSGQFNLSDSEIKSGSFNALGQLGFDMGPFLIDLTYHHGLSNAVQITNFQGSSRRILSASVGFKF